MKQKTNKDETKNQNISSRKKTKTQLIPKENFDTGSHTPSLLRNVGAGYDDTGLGDYVKDNETTDEDKNNQQKKKSRKQGKK